MKAQGISSYYIGKSIVWETILLVLMGCITALILAVISNFVFISTSIPFLINPYIYIGIILLFLLFSIISGLISFLTVARIDPIKAIG